MVKLLVKISVYSAFGYLLLSDLKRKSVAPAGPNVDGLIMLRYFCSVANEVASDSIADIFTFVSSPSSASQKLEEAKNYLSKKFL